MEPCIRRLAEEIRKRINFSNHLPFHDEFAALLRILEPQEKILLKQYFRSLEWNVESINVLATLQSCKVISTTEYILTQDDNEHVQLVLNDLLETKFELLSNLLISCYYDYIHTTKLTAILEECFKRLFRDLITNPDSMTVNYFDELKRVQLPDEVLQMLKEMNVNVLSENRSQIKAAFGNFHLWNNAVEEDSFLHKLLSEIVSDTQPMLHYILKKSLEPDFQGCKYFMILLQLLARNCTKTEATEIKQHLKDIFKRLLRDKDDRLFYVFLFTARVIHSVKNPCLDMYQQWFKTNIGEMGYNVNAQEFKYIMSILRESLSVETECTFLEIQSNTAISAPPMCNQLVLDYKKSCRRRMSVLKDGNVQNSIDMDESIIID